MVVLAADGPVRLVEVTEAVQRVVQVLIGRGNVCLVESQVRPRCLCQLHGLPRHLQLGLIVQHEDIEMPQLRQSVLPQQRVGILALSGGIDSHQKVAHGLRVVLLVAVGAARVVAGAFLVDGVAPSGEVLLHPQGRVWRGRHDVALVAQANGEHVVFLPHVLRGTTDGVRQFLGPRLCRGQVSLAEHPRLFDDAEQLPLLATVLLPPACPEQSQQAKRNE